MSNRFFLNCDCGCEEGVSFVNDMGQVFVSFMMPYFYVLQGNAGLKIKKYAKAGKPVFDIVITDEQLNQLEEFLMNCSFEGQETADMLLNFHINKLFDDSYSFEVYFVEGKDVSINDLYRAFDCMLDKDQVSFVLSLIRKAKTQKPVEI